MCWLCPKPNTGHGAGEDGLYCYSNVGLGVSPSSWWDGLCSVYKLWSPTFILPWHRAPTPFLSLTPPPPHFGYWLRLPCLHTPAPLSLVPMREVSYRTERSPDPVFPWGFVWRRHCLMLYSLRRRKHETRETIWNHHLDNSQLKLIK